MEPGHSSPGCVCSSADLSLPKLLAEPVASSDRTPGFFDHVAPPPRRGNMALSTNRSPRADLAVRPFLPNLR